MGQHLKGQWGTCKIVRFTLLCSKDSIAGMWLNANGTLGHLLQDTGPLDRGALSDLLPDGQKGCVVSWLHTPLEGTT